MGEYKHGGARPGAGRKRKEAEMAIIEAMDGYCAPNEFWGKLWAKVESGDMKAIALWANYRFGMPKQNVEMSAEISNGLTLPENITLDQLKEIVSASHSEGGENTDSAT